jgi:hypothetical protein
MSNRTGLFGHTKGFMAWIQQMCRSIMGSLQTRNARYSIASEKARKESRTPAHVQKIKCWTWFEILKFYGCLAQVQLIRLSAACDMCIEHRKYHSVCCLRRTWLFLEADSKAHVGKNTDIICLELLQGHLLAYLYL